MASPGVSYPTTESEYHPLKPSSPSPPTTSIPMDSYSLPHTGGRPPPQAASGYAAGGPPRTPSPTPSDIEELKKGAIDFKKLMNWRTWLKRKYLWYYVAAVLCIAIVALVSIYHKQIVDALTPASQYLRTLPGGWSIPIGVMFVLSFPPLFGNEIVHVLCGIVWGIWIGFGIVCAGTFLGEVGNFYAFRYCCKSRGEKLEKNSLSYACLAKVVREGGFLIALIIRLSAIPGHFTTAVFSTCGMGIISFSLGAFLSLPKQFATVYIGVILHQAAGQQTTQQRLLSAGVLALTTIITIFAAWWVWKKMNAAKPAVLAERRKAKALALYNQKMYDMRNADLESASNVNLVGGPPGKNTPYDTASSSSTVTVGRFNNNSSNHLWPSNAKGSVDFGKSFNTSESTVNLPLSVKPQRWDAHGRAVVDHQPDFGDGSHHHSGPEEQDWSRRPPPAGAKLPAVVHGGTQAQQYGGPTAPPDIRVIRASGASSNTHESLMPGRLPYDPPPVSTEIPPASSSSSPRSPPTSPSKRRGPPQSPPQGSYAPRRQSEDSSESGPQWAAGMTQDDAEAATPLTSGFQASRSVPANMHSSPSPSYAPQQRQQQQPPQVMTMSASASQPARMQSYDAPASPYDNVALYNPFDRARQQQHQPQQQPQQQVAGRHRWEETDATAASYHTADGTMGSAQYAAATQRQLPPPSELRQQQTPSPPGGFGGAYYPPQQQQYGGSSYGRQ